MAKQQVKDKRGKGFKGNPAMGWSGSIIYLIIVVFLTGCNNSPPPPPGDFVIKAGPVMVSSEEFAQELDLKLIAYPYDIKTNPSAYNAMVLDLVSTLSDETLLLAAARAKGIKVTPKELESAEQAFKEDYPEDSFDHMLLDNAISYTVWKNRFKKDMVIGKLVQEDLVDVQEITPEDMVAFYNHMDRGEGAEGGQAIDEAGLVEQLRREKSQASYEQWIQDLKSAYPLEIDNKAVAAFLIKQE